MGMVDKIERIRSGNYFLELRSQMFDSKSLAHSKKVLLFVHGCTHCGRSRHEYALKIAQQSGCEGFYMPDLVGYGFSTGPSNTINMNVHLSAMRTVIRHI